MTGFIRGLFGGSNAQSGEAAPAPKKVDRQPKESKDFFLDMNEARTFGNLEYMQTAKKVKRTFPKTAGQPEEMEYVQEVSAMGRMIEGQKSVPVVSSTPIVETKETTSSTTNGSVDRRKADSSMDMFRKMAKDIRK